MKLNDLLINDFDLSCDHDIQICRTFNITLLQSRQGKCFLCGYDGKGILFKYPLEVRPWGLRLSTSIRHFPGIMLRYTCLCVLVHK